MKLHRRNHPSVTLARRELVLGGYRQGFTAPGSPAKWIKKGHEALAIGREDRPRSSVFHIVPYPEGL